MVLSAESGDEVVVVLESALFALSGTLVESLPGALVVVASESPSSPEREAPLSVLQLQSLFGFLVALESFGCTCT